MALSGLGVALCALGVNLALSALGPVSATGNGNSGSDSQPQPYSNADKNNVGANDTSPGNPYKSTRDGSPSGNGNGGGQAVGQPCAGCAGKADNKNPPGQAPNGSDGNSGYECDSNNGIGQSNPAHTSCANLPPGSTTTTTTPPPPPPGSTTTTTTPGSTTTTTNPQSTTTTTISPGSSGPGPHSSPNGGTENPANTPFVVVSAGASAPTVAPSQPVGPLALTGSSLLGLTIFGFLLSAAGFLLLCFESVRSRLKRTG